MRNPFIVDGNRGHELQHCRFHSAGILQENFSQAAKKKVGARVRKLGEAERNNLCAGLEMRDL
jgi:hypothetical protein